MTASAPRAALPSLRLVPSDVRFAERIMVNIPLARDSPDFQSLAVAKWHNGHCVRFDEGCGTSYLSGMSQTPPETPENAAPGKDLSPAAIRALQEAAERRRQETGADRPTERNGPSGEEPTRYGDWERGGIAYDF